MTEKTVAKVHPYRIILKGYYVLAAIFIIAFIVSYFYPQLVYYYSPAFFWLNYKYISFSTGIAAIIMLFLAESDIKIHEYSVTNMRIIKRKGLFVTWEYDITWKEIDRYAIKRTFIDKLLGNNVGSIVVKFSGSDGYQTLFEHIENVNKIKNLMDKFTGRIKK